MYASPEENHSRRAQPPAALRGIDFQKFSLHTFQNPLLQSMCVCVCVCVCVC